MRATTCCVYVRALKSRAVYRRAVSDRAALPSKSSYTSTTAVQFYLVCSSSCWFYLVRRRSLFVPSSLSYERITAVTMDILPSGNIFRELQDIHDTGYFSAQPSLEDHWQQVRTMRLLFIEVRALCARNAPDTVFFSFARGPDGTLNNSEEGSVSRYGVLTVEKFERRP